jgi:HK97 family phage major capsid protein
MSDFIKSQSELRANLINQVRDVLDFAEGESRGLDSAELDKIARIEADIAKADDSIAVARRAEERKLEASVAAKGFVPSVMDVQDDAAMIRSIARGEARSHEFRTLTPTSGTGVVPFTFFDRVFEVIQNTNPIFETSTILTTEGGNILQVPQLTARSTATIKGAGSAIAESDPVFSNVNLGAWKYSFLVNLSNEIVSDSGIDLLGFVANISGTEIAYDAGNGLTNGTGTVEPTGLVTAAGSGIVGGTGVSGAPSYENLVDLVYSVAGNTRARYGFHMGSSAIAAVRKIKDGAGNYIFTPSISVDGRDYIMGSPIFENPVMPAVAVNAKSIVYGKLDDFIIRQVGGIQVATSTDFKFADDVTTLRITWRGDSNLGAAGSVKFFRGGTA